MATNLTFTQKYSYSIIIGVVFFIVAFLLFGCDSKYTNSTLRTLKKGDTIYRKYLKQNVRCIVIKNDSIARVIEVKQSNVYDSELYRIEILNYSEL